MYTETTRSIRIAVEPFYVADQSEPNKERWVFGYRVRIENVGGETVQLLTRHWRITDGRGMVSFVDGEGVVGEQPLLKPGQSHDYVSGCPLATHHGSMEGHYTMRRADGALIEVAIPFFPLAAPATAG